MIKIEKIDSDILPPLSHLYLLSLEKRLFLQYKQLCKIKKSNIKYQLTNFIKSEVKKWTLKQS